MTGSHHISDTALAATLATLGVPLDTAQPYTRIVDTLTSQERIEWLFADGTANPEGINNHKTEFIVGAWVERARLEREHPSHPLVPMRAALDARRYILDVLLGKQPLVPVEYERDRHHTGQLWEAALLRAHGFPLLLTTGTTFTFPAVWKNQTARQIVEESQRVHGRKASQWMSRFLVNYSQFLALAKAAVPRLIERDGNNTLNLSADAPAKVRDQFQDQFAAL